MSNESSVTLRGIVEKVIPSVTTGPDIVQIAVIKAEELYREIRIPNTLRDANGNVILLSEGTHVEITITRR